MDPISRSIANAPPGMTLDAWARTTIEGRVLILFRDLTEPQQEAFIRGLRRIAAGMPIPEAAVLMYRECGDTEAEARERAKRVLPGAGTA